jgi:hypothetical protein
MDSPVTLALDEGIVNVKAVAGAGTGIGGGFKTVSLYAAATVAPGARAEVTPRGI